MIRLEMIGNIGKDAVVRKVNERYVVEFPIAHNQKHKDQDGKEIERTTWVNVSRWYDTNPSRFAGFLTKGSKVFVSGVPEVQLYKNKEGRYVTSLRVSSRDIHFVDMKKTDDAPPAEWDDIPETSELPESDI